MDFVKTPVTSFQTRISKMFLDNMQDGIVEGITKAEEALKKAGSGGGSGGSGTVTSVNGIEPDESGNVDVTIPTIKAEIGADGTTLTITNPDGTVQMVTIKNGEDGKNGSSATIQATEIEGGYELTIRDASGVRSIQIMHGKDGADGTGGAEWFTGNTSNVAPQDVMSAIAAGKTLLINHTDDTYGILMFTNFAVAAGMNIVVSSVAIENLGRVMNASLIGNLANGTWNFVVRQLATLDDIPEEKTATSVDLSGFENGTVVETYADGSTNTYTFEFDSDGNPTKITDSNGNTTVLTW